MEIHNLGIKINNKVVLVLPWAVVDKERMQELEMLQIMCLFKVKLFCRFHGLEHRIEGRILEALDLVGNKATQERG